MELIRLPDWRAQLMSYLQGLEGATYQPRKFHCIHFVAGAVEVMTGKDLMEGFHGKSQAASRELLEAAGFDDWPDVLADHRVEMADMRVGDIAVIPDKRGRKAGGICLGARISVLGPQGLSTTPRDEAEYGLKV